MPRYEVNQKTPIFYYLDFEDELKHIFLKKILKSKYLNLYFKFYV